MLHPRAKLPDPQVFPIDPWRLIESGFRPEYLGLSETLFALANGYLGIRGSLEEQAPSYERGTFVNGFYETWPINYPEEAYGLPTEGQTIVTLPDPAQIALHIDGEPMLLTHGRVLRHDRVLDLQAGVLERHVEWESPAGMRVRVRTERLVSFAHRHLAAFTFEAEVIEGEGAITVVSSLANPHAPARPPRGEEARDPRRPRDLADALALDSDLRQGQRVLLAYHTRRSGQRLACGIDHRFEANVPVELANREDTEAGAVEYAFDGRAGASFRLEKFAVFHTSAEEETADLVPLAAADLSHALANGFAAAHASQREHMDTFWERADVRVEGDDVVQQAVRWNMFQLAQACLRTDGRGVPAKGLTGRGYDGHYFWDVEIYVQPFLAYTYPEIARRLLGFRHGMLDTARGHARTMGEEGALFPWRTIGGEEASGYFPSSTAQYHIDADIAYALKHYVEVTGDRGVLAEFGAELLVETSRFWATLGFYPLEDGEFHIHGVTGPDEYSTVVDDNAYTNLMARENLAFAADVIDDLRKRDPEVYRELAEHVHLDPDEPAVWRRAAERMYVVFDKTRGIHPQDAHFLDKEPWDFAGTPPDHYPLLLHYHPLVLHRHQVIKQADLVLAMFLLEQHFSREQRRANFLYYEPITTGDSSLSHAVESIVAADVGEQDIACMHFEHALFMDLSDWAGNAEDGVHIASAGGVWLALVYGFGGLHDAGGTTNFEPHLPAAWRRIVFRLRVRQCVLEVDIEHGALRLQLRAGDALDVRVRGEPLTLRAGEPATVALGP